MTDIAEQYFREQTRRSQIRVSLRVLVERRNWLTERIKAKNVIGWDVEWDTRERDALAHVIKETDRLLVLDMQRWEKRIQEGEGAL